MVGADASTPSRWFSLFVLGRGGKPGDGGYGVDVSATMVSGAKGASIMDGVGDRQGRKHHPWFFYGMRCLHYPYFLY